jgi:hypothetical protein
LNMREFLQIDHHLFLLWYISSIFPSVVSPRNALPLHNFLSTLSFFPFRFSAKSVLSIDSPPYIW